MRANMNFEEMSNENLFNVAGGVKSYSNRDEAETVRKEIEKAEIEEKEKKMKEDNKKACENVCPHKLLFVRLQGLEPWTP